MRRVDVAPEAQSDLREIARFTQRKWGAAQRRTYMAQFEEARQALAADRAVAFNVDEVKAGLQAMRVGRHLLFFTLRQDGSVAIARILHASQDHVRHL